MVTITKIAFSSFCLHFYLFTFISAFTFPNLNSILSMNKNKDENGPDQNEKTSDHKKQVVLIRHGCTYMNEYLSNPGCQWGDADFTDIFPSAAQEENEVDEKKRKYRDSPLSPRGVRQAQNLSNQLLNKRAQYQNVMNEIDLIVVSPLTRALQTTELGLKPYFDSIDPNREQGSNVASNFIPPIIALPYAAERLYLISDVGMSTSKLKARFPYVDFESEFQTKEEKEKWWFSLLESNDDNDSDQYYELKDIVIGTKQKSKYEEWRPRDERQKYAHPGEPDDYFYKRMSNLVNWINSREEKTIAIVCHWGVIDCLIGEDFENCEMRVVDFETDIKSRMAQGHFTSMI